MLGAGRGEKQGGVALPKLTMVSPEQQKTGGRTESSGPCSVVTLGDLPVLGSQQIKMPFIFVTGTIIRLRF